MGTIVDGEAVSVEWSPLRSRWAAEIAAEHTNAEAAPEAGQHHERCVMDAAGLYAKLRSHTAAQLGYDSEKLTPSQAARLDMICGLKLEADRIATTQLRGEAIDPKQLLMVGEALEAALRPAEHVSTNGGPRACSSRERLRQLIERTVLADEAANAAKLADAMVKEEAVAAAEAFSAVELSAPPVEQEAKAPPPTSAPAPTAARTPAPCVLVYPPVACRSRVVGVSNAFPTRGVRAVASSDSPAADSAQSARMVWLPSWAASFAPVPFDRRLSVDWWQIQKKAAPCGSDRSTKLQSGRPKRAGTDTARDGGNESALNSSRAATNARVRPATHFRKLAASGTFRGDGLTRRDWPMGLREPRNGLCPWS